MGGVQTQKGGDKHMKKRKKVSFYLGQHIPGSSLPASASLEMCRRYEKDWSRTRHDEGNMLQWQPIAGFVRECDSTRGKLNCRLCVREFRYLEHSNRIQ